VARRGGLRLEPDVALGVGAPPRAVADSRRPLFADSAPDDPSGPPAILAAAIAASGAGGGSGGRGAAKAGASAGRVVEGEVHVMMVPWAGSEVGGEGRTKFKVSAVRSC
jgi:hypothetical protein